MKKNTEKKNPERRDMEKNNGKTRNLTRITTCFRFQPGYSIFRFQYVGHSAFENLEEENVSLYEINVSQRTHVPPKSTAHL